VLEYPTDRLALPGDAEPREVPGRVSLLDNLIEHRATSGAVPLIAPLARTEPFTALIEVIANAPPPTPIPDRWVATTGAAPERHTVIRGVNAVLRRAADELALLSELDVAWAVEPHIVAFDGRDLLQTRGRGSD
jgi:hypothetical protein